MEKIEIGEKIKPFKALDSSGNFFSDENFIGKTTVLYFYPKDMTPGCTQEACDFQANIEMFNRLGVQIVGVSPDSAKSHKKFIEKHALDFTLIVDEDAELCKHFKVFKDKTLFGIKALGVERSTFIIDKEGKIVWIEHKVKVAGHSARILDFLHNFLKP
jgi:peroxiredoxin Q/BCP